MMAVTLSVVTCATAVFPLTIYIYIDIDRFLTPYTKLHTVQQQPIVAPFSESRCRQNCRYLRYLRYPSGALADRLSQGHVHQFHFLEVDFSHETSLPSKSWLNPLSSTAATNGRSFGPPPAVVAEHRWGVPDRPNPLQERMPKQYIYICHVVCVNAMLYV